MDTRENKGNLFSSEEQELMTSYSASVHENLKANTELRKSLQNANENVGEKFRNYLMIASTYLPPSILIEETHDSSQNTKIGKDEIMRQTFGYKKYLLPATAEIYQVHNPPPRDELSPENPNFLGFENLPRRNLSEEFGGDYVKSSERFTRLIDENLDQEGLRDPKINEAKSSVEETTLSYLEEEKRLKNELGARVKRRLTNLRNTIAHHIGGRRLPKRITEKHPDQSGNVLCYLPVEDKMVKITVKKNLLGRMTPRFSHYQEVDDDAYMDFTPSSDLMIESGLRWYTDMTFHREENTDTYQHWLNTGGKGKPKI